MWNRDGFMAFAFRYQKGKVMKGIIAWFLGVPVVVIIILYVLGIF